MNERGSVGLVCPLTDSALGTLGPLAKWKRKNRYQLSANAAFWPGWQVGPQLTYVFFFLSNSTRTLAEAAELGSEGALGRSLAGWFP